MSGARLYSEKTAAEVREAVARGEPIRTIAARYNMSPATVSNMARFRIYRPEEDVRAEQRARCAAMRAARAQQQRVDPAIVEDAVRHPTGVVAQAVAERNTGKPLVVETLEQRLEKAIPGAVVVETTSTRVVARFAVWVDGARSGRIVTGHTSREAVDKAIALWGAR